MNIENFVISNLENPGVMSNHSGSENVHTFNNQPIEFNNLLQLAKSNDPCAIEQLLKNHNGLIVYQCKGIFLSSYTYDDLVQTATLTFLKAIQSFDIDKGNATFASYVFKCIQNNFRYLCRKEIKYNECSSLNTEDENGIEPVNLLPYNEILEDVVMKHLTSIHLIHSLHILDKEELGLINFLYINHSTEKKPYLSNYSKLKGKEYYYCTLLKKRALHKLKKFTK